MPPQADPTEVQLAEAERVARGLGLPGLRPKQAEVLRCLAAGRNVFAGLPTGYGKSLCFWLPASAWGWRVWVVSPLISLIEDQALACERAGLKAIAWSGRMSRERRQALEARMEEGGWQLCFLAPERLSAWERSGFLARLRALGLGPELLVLDEMHCLEEWRAFRPAYGELFGHVRRNGEGGGLLLGLSASMGERESEAWMAELCEEHERVEAGLGRENLVLRVVAIEEEEARWLLLLEALSGLRAPATALVYCSTREECDDLARWLRSAGFEAVPYHAGLPAAEKSARSAAFRAGRLRVVCATSAFGMGVDYPHVSLVVHFSMPRDLESYWQEVGRAGRGGEAARAVAFWRRSEIFRIRGMEPEERARFLALWRAWLAGTCRRRAVAERLGLPGAASEACGRCDSCFPGGPGALPAAWWTQAAAAPLEWLEEALQLIENPC